MRSHPHLVDAEPTGRRDYVGQLMLALLLTAWSPACRVNEQGEGVRSHPSAVTDSPSPPDACRARRLNSTACFAPLKAVAAGGAGRYCLGDSRSDEEAYWCQDVGSTSICRTIHNATERIYESGTLRRIRMHRDGRLAPLAFGRPQRPFAGVSFRTAEGVEPGMPLSDALVKLGHAHASWPWVDPDFGPVVVYDYPGIELQADKVDGRDVVGAIVIK